MTELRCLEPALANWHWSPDADVTLAWATWVARCASAMAEAGWGIELEPARAVAQELSHDDRLRALDPEWVGARMVAGR